MKRLTGRRYKGNGHYLMCSANCDRDCGEDCDHLVDAIDRLAAIEDILGDEYELDRLRELVGGLQRCVLQRGQRA